MTTLNSQYIQTMHQEAYQLMQEFIVLLNDTIAAYERSWAYRRHLAKPDKHFRVINVEELKALLNTTVQNPNTLASTLAKEIVNYLNDRSKFHFFARLSPLRSKLHGAVKSYSKAHSLSLLDDRLKLVQDYNPNQKVEIAEEDSKDSVENLTSYLEEQDDQLLAAETDIALLNNENEELKATVADLRSRVIADDQALQEALKTRQDDQIKALRSDLTEAKNTIVEQQEVIEQQRTLLQRLNEKFTKLLELAPELVAHIKKLFVPNHARHQQAVNLEENMAAINKDLKSASIGEAQPKQRRVTFARQNSSRLFSPKHAPMLPHQPIKPEPAAGLPLRFKPKDDVPPPPQRDDSGLWSPSKTMSPVKAAQSPIATPEAVVAAPPPPPAPAPMVPAKATMIENKFPRQVKAHSQNNLATELETVKMNLRTPVATPLAEQTNVVLPPAFDAMLSRNSAIQARRAAIAESPNSSMNNTFG